VRGYRRDPREDVGVLGTFQILTVKLLLDEPGVQVARDELRMP
jgi:hypothetical protein